MGVFVFDVPPTTAPVLEAAIASVTDAPVTHMVYSHAHTEHIGGAKLFPTAEIYAHADAAALIPFIDGEQPPMPAVTFDDRLKLAIGSLDIALEYFGHNHDPGNIFITLPEAPVLMVVDIIEGGDVPWTALNYT
ncbi:MAG: MBL fold metallo-hydrolase [Leptolyngbya sp. SIO1E4]|nr:MBL fold metallo-hydrolase [Leptolyngbya sp. SIO1E4]